MLSLQPDFSCMQGHYNQAIKTKAFKNIYKTKN